MDIKKQYFDGLKAHIEHAYDTQLDTMKAIAKLFSDTALNGGVVQLFGVNHGEEFVNELNFRAGGLAPFHGIKLVDLVLNGVCDGPVIDSGEVLNSDAYLDKLLSLYKLDPRDCYVIVSEKGCEPLVIALAKKVKAHGHKLVGVVNQKTYERLSANLDEKLGDYCDLMLDLSAEDPDVALHVADTPVGQYSSTIGNVMAQMITAEGYAYYRSLGKEAPVLLSANIKGADKHNDSLTDPYEGRVR